ncbi:MAG: tetratricopeptide repeat protein [Betaproteobacteria bacterium]|nr:tetratricopeptide repeat protein [Betaproteobacteria bacterium]
MKLAYVLALILAFVPPLAVARSSRCEEGVNAAVSEKHAEAISILSECLEKRPSESARARLLEFRAQAYMKLNMAAQALDDQKLSVSIERSRNSWWVDTKPDEVPQAPDDQKLTIIKIPKRDVWSLIRLASYHRELKQYDEALAVLKEAEKYVGDGPHSGLHVAFYVGRTLYEMGRYAEAVDAFTLGLAKQPTYTYAIYNRGISFQALGNAEQAKRDFLRLAELAPAEDYISEIVEKLKEFKIDLKLMKKSDDTSAGTRGLAK